jgi:hypothetical protein
MMNGNLAVEVIKQEFEKIGHQVKIPLQKGRSFKAEMTDEGIMVDNLGGQPLLPWIVFEEVIDLLVRMGGRAENGNAMGCKLGDEGLPLESIEGHVAHEVYGKEIGISITRRISPISAILVWAGLCETAPGELILC